MLKQTLKKIYRFFNPSKKTNPAAAKSNTRTSIFTNESEQPSGTRVLRPHNSNQKQLVENATANENDWWIN